MYAPERRPSTPSWTCEFFSATVIFVSTCFRCSTIDLGVECGTSNAGNGLRNKYGQRQEREGDLLSSVTTLEDEKEVLARVLVMAEERYDHL